MKKTILYGLTAVAILFASCTKDLTNDFSANDGFYRGELITVNAVIEDSRLSSDATGKLSWNAGDEIAVICWNEDGTGYAIDPDTYKMQITAGGQTTVSIPDNTAYAIYPASRVSASNLKDGVLTLSLPWTYTVDTPEQIFNHNLMKGSFNPDPEVLTIDFANLMGYVQVPLTGEGIVKGVTLKSETQEWAPLSNKCTLALDEDASTSEAPITMATDNKAFSYVKVAFKEGLDLSTNPSVSIPVPAGVEYSNLGLVVVKENESNTFYAKNKHAISRGSIKPISQNPINPANFTPQSPTSLSGSTGTNYNDYASCYIVPPVAGAYSFKTTLVDGTTLNEGVCAEILWSEGKTLVYDLHYDATTNTISFKTDGTEGNALVAFSKNTFGGSDIEWFWHIWVTDTPQHITIGTTGNSNKYTFMDRVVGATWAPSTALTSSSTETVSNVTFNICTSVSEKDASDACGLYYQYQNRVPSPRIINVNNNVKETLTKKLANARVAVAYGFTQYAQYWSTSKAAGVITRNETNGQLYSVNMIYPYYMYAVADTNNDEGISGGSKNSWCYTPLIGNQGVNPNDSEVTTTFEHGTDGIAYRLWNNKNGGKAPALKTPHDPCPPGYIIEVSNNGYWWADKNTNIETIVRNPVDDDSFAAGYRVYGIYFDGVDASGNAASLYLPCAGNRYACLINREPSNSWANMGYLYFYNTDNDKDKDSAAFAYYSTLTTKYSGPGFENVEAKGVHKTFPGANIQYGARNSGALAKRSRNANKTVNAQAYNVRCITGK